MEDDLEKENVIDISEQVQNKGEKAKENLIRISPCRRRCSYLFLPRHSDKEEKDEKGASLVHPRGICKRFPRCLHGPGKSINLLY